MLKACKEETVTQFEHPFGAVLRAVFKEMYPDKAPPDDSPINSVGIPEGVIREAFNRYHEGMELIISTPFAAKEEDSSPKQEKKSTFRYA
jgi:hypothetical protein